MEPVISDERRRESFGFHNTGVDDYDMECYII